MIQDTKRFNVKHVKASTWIPEDEMQQIHRLKGDISTSLWIKRAIRNALLEEGRQAANQDDPINQPAVVPNAVTFVTPQGPTKSKEVDVK
jgi:hypothetical protein